jgi:colanic acid biosynthesis glycosyl transferase WcaI
VPSKAYGILAAGRPFIAATDPACEAAAIARDHRCGVLAPPGDPIALAERITALHESPDSVRQMGMNARRAAWQFDRRVAVQAYFDLLTSVVGLDRAA